MTKSLVTPPSSSRADENEFLLYWIAEAAPRIEHFKRGKTSLAFWRVSAGLNTDAFGQEFRDTLIQAIELYEQEPFQSLVAEFTSNNHKLEQIK